MSELWRCALVKARMLGFFALFCAGPQVMRAQTLPIEVGYEATEGYSLGLLGSSGNWVTSGSFVIGSTAIDGSQSLRLGDSLDFPKLSLTFNNPSSEGIVFVDFYLTPVARQLNSLPVEVPTGSAAVMSLVAAPSESSGVLYLAEGTPSQVLWTNTNLTFPLTDGRASAWVRYTYRLDYTSKLWDLYIDGNLVALRLAFLDQTLTGFKNFTLKGSATTASYFDSFYAGPENPLFADQDSDGMSDSYEVAEGLLVDSDDRLLDKDHDSLTNIDEFAFGIHAANPDSDDDEVDDGSELRNGTDPMNGDVFQLSGIPFNETFDAIPTSSLAGYQDWQVSGTDPPLVSSEAAYSGAKGVKFSGAGALSLPVAGKGQEVAWTELWIKPVVSAADAEETYNSFAASVFYFRADGVIRYLDGDTSLWNSTRVLDDISQWQRVTVRQDFSQQKWSLWIDGFPVIQNVSFSNAAPFYRSFKVSQKSTLAAFLDEVTIAGNTSTPSGLQEDSDMDGLPDAWEVVQFGSLAGLPGADPDGDGILNRQEWKLGTPPNLPNDLIGKPSLPFSENFESYAAGAQLVGSGRWIGYGASEVRADAAPQGTKALHLTHGSVETRINGYGHPLVWIDQLIRPASRFAAVPGSNTVAAYFFDQNGYLNVFDGTNSQWEKFPAIPIPINLAPIAENAWARVTVKLDYSTQTWAIWLNGVRAASDLGFARTSAYFSRYAFASGRDADLDALTISVSEPNGLVEPITDGEPPTTPGQPEMHILGESMVSIDWTPSTDNVGLQTYRIYRNGVLLAETTSTSYTDTTLTAGTAYSYTVQTVDTSNNLSSLSAALELNTPSLQRLGTGLKGSYFDRLFFKDHKTDRLDAKVSFVWYFASPDPALEDWVFSSRWVGVIEPEYTGEYTFESYADDGIKLWVDGKLVINRFFGGKETNTGTVKLEAGRFTPIVFEYYTTSGTSRVNLRWKSPVASTSVLVDTPYLYPAPPGTDITNPSAPSNLHAKVIGDNDLILAWDPAVDNRAVAAYRVFRDGSEIARTLVPEFHDEALQSATAHSYAVKSEDFAGLLSALGSEVELTTAATTLPEFWRHRDIGPPFTRGSSSFADNKFTVTGAGRDIEAEAGRSSPDEGQFVSRKFSGDFMITARVDSFTATDPLAKAGVMIRNGFDGHDHYFASSLTKGAGAKLTSRTSYETNTWYSTTSYYAAPYWVRAVRVGNAFIGSYSPDGVNWQTVASQIVSMNAEVEAGLFVCSHQALETATAVFSNVTLTEDIELEGAEGLDTDGDGISDQDEVSIYGTDPNAPDIWVSGNVVSLPGSSGVTTFGSWHAQGTALVSSTIKASADFEVTVTEPGIYRIEAEVSSGYNETNNRIFPINVSMDGQLLEQFNAYLDGFTAGFLHASTPWLTSGSHTIRLNYDNTMSFRSLKILGVRLQKLEGVDSDEDGDPDWMSEIIDTGNQVASGLESVISPACVEGTTRYRSTFKFEIDGQETEVNPAPGLGWYVNVPLDAVNAVPVTAKFESGAKEQTLNLIWKTLNLFTDVESAPENVIKIRKGDSLLLAALPVGVSAGAGVITISQSGVEPIEIAVAGSGASPHLFEAAGTYTVIASFTPTGGTAAASEALVVQVIDAEFNGNPVAAQYPPSIWDNPKIPGSIVITQDQGIELSNPTPIVTGGTRFALITGNLGESYVIVRPDEEGPVSDHAVVRGLKVSNNTDTSIDILEVYEDGSMLIGTPIILNHVSPNVRVQVEITVGSASFDDGTLVKVFTAADFDQFGRVYVKFLKKANAVTSYCHRILVYEGDVLLGTF